MNAFITDVKNPQGIFALQVYIRGVPKILLVDDYIPFYGKYFLSYNFIVPYSA
jgi:predicted nucleotide-binding protein (sugar kinase/HSP70/actin superfamily)